jgi:hypothetical protein
MHLQIAPPVMASWATPFGLRHELQCLVFATVQRIT